MPRFSLLLAALACVPASKAADDKPAAGIAVGAWSNALSLLRRGSTAFGFSLDAAARRRLPRITLAALVMGREGGLAILEEELLPVVEEVDGDAVPFAEIRNGDSVEKVLS